MVAGPFGRCGRAGEVFSYRVMLDNSRTTADDFHKLLEVLGDRRRFRPFTVELVGGRRFDVDYDRASVERDGAAVLMAPGGVPIWFDHDRVTAIVSDTADASA